ncbi:MAG: NADH-quinone oxidoreductase subunit N [Terracidiphilus sp.]|jgi:NADH-quinone oxidoreductase subunit N
MNYADLFRVTLPETMLEIAALVVLVVDLGFLRKAALKLRVTAAALIGVAGCGAALWTVGLQNGKGFSVGGWEVLVVSPVAVVAQVGILVLTALTLLLLINQDFTRHVGEYVAVVLMAAVGGLLIAAAQDLLVIFIGLELLSLGLYIITAFAKSSGKSAEAAMKYYLFGGMSAAFLLFGFSYLYGLSGSTNLAEIEQGIPQAGMPLLYVAWVLIVAGLGFKVAAVPFHLWAPDTYEGAPAPAAAFIASVSKVASFTLLLNICYGLFQPGREWSGPPQLINEIFRTEFAIWQPLLIVLIVVAAASMVVGNLAALAQTSVRRLLAYSAIAHAGYILLGIAVRRPYPGYGDSIRFVLDSFGPALRSNNAVLFYVLTYGLTTIGAFGVVAVVERATGSDRIDSFSGLHKRNPVLAAVLLVLFLSLAGIPPLVGFYAKFNLFAAVLGVSAGPVPFALVALAVALSAVSLYYYLQVLKRAYVMPAVDESPIKGHPVTMAVLVAIASAVVLLGCFPALLQNWIESFYR